MKEMFISNVEKKDICLLMKAANLTNTKIVVKKKPHTADNRLIKGCVAINTLDPNQDHSAMWVKFHELKGDYHARKIIDLDFFRPRYY